jgi:hypothetical protein
MRNETSNPLRNPNKGEIEIDLMTLAKTLWRDRKIIWRIVLISGIIGLFIAMLTPKEYMAWTSMVPQTSKMESKLGGLSSLAAMAGFNLDMSSNAEDLSPMVYPQIVSSVPFQLELMNTPFSFSDVDHPVSLYTYYTDIASPGILFLIGKYTIGLPGLLMEAVKSEPGIRLNPEGKGPINLTRKQEEIRKLIDTKVNLTVDAKQGFLTMQASFHEAILSAQVADQARELLQKYITRYKIEKASDQLAFVEERYKEKKIEFEKVQEQLARFRDQNKNVSSAMAATQEFRLQSEYTISLNVYNELAKQLEQAKIQVKEATPVFSVIEPASVPQKKAKPNRPLILFLSLFFGGIIGIGFVLGKHYLKNLKKKWKDHS